MFRRDDVHRLNGLVHIGGNDDLAVGVHAGPGDGRTGQLRDLHFQFRLHGQRQFPAVGDQHRLASLSCSA